MCPTRAAVERWVKTGGREEGKDRISFTVALYFLHKYKVGSIVHRRASWSNTGKKSLNLYQVKIKFKWANTCKSFTQTQQFEWVSPPSPIHINKAIKP